MDDFAKGCLAMLLGIAIAGLSQLMLKKAADKEYKSLARQYVNVNVILGYAIMVASTLCSVFAHRYLPLSLSPVWDALSQIIVIMIGLLALHEKISLRKGIGLALMVSGILIFML